MTAAIQQPLRLLPPIPPKMTEAAVNIPTSIVCKTCKEETGLTPEILADQEINGDICCPICSHVIFSCLPEKPIYTTGSHMTIYDNYD